MSSEKICPFCKGTGVHLAPDVVELITIKCTHKECDVSDFSFGRPVKLSVIPRSENPIPDNFTAQDLVDFLNKNEKR